MDLAAAVRSEIVAVDPDAATDPLSTMEASLASWISPVRFFARLLTALAALAIALAALGIYGVVAYTVSQRTREIGIRMALGAQHRDVLALVLREGMGLAALGVLLGALASIATTRWLRSELYDTSATDPLTFLLSAVVLAGIALLATMLPARRATAIDPARTLQSE